MLVLDLLGHVDLSFTVIYAHVLRLGTQSD